MGVEIRLPQITGATDREQLQQIKSYIYQLREQLQYAFDTVNTTGAAGSSGNGTQQIMPSYARPSGSSGSNAESTFNEIKSLIIKSADIVDAYYEEINKRLESVYVAESKFGTYAKETKALIDVNSESITQNYDSVQILIRKNEELEGTIDSSVAMAKNELSGEIDAVSGRIGKTEQMIDQKALEIYSSLQEATNSLSDTDRMLESAKAQLQRSIDNLGSALGVLAESVVGVTAYVKSGILYETDKGVPVYGVEIGQEVEKNGVKKFSKFSRFTAEKLSFYDSNDNEVAYMSDMKLYIGQAEIRVSLKVGGIVTLVMDNGDVVEKWEWEGAK